MRRITAVAVAVAAAIIAACEGSGSPNSISTGPYCTTLQASQDANNWSNCEEFLGGGGGGGGGGLSPGEAPAALYRLVLVNNSPLPFNFGGTEDSVQTTDSTRVINFLLDSSYISLNTDSSAMEIDYMHIRDERFSSTTHPPSNWNPPPYYIADTSTGTWSDSTGQPTLLLTTGKVSNIGYQYHGDTLSADYAYNITDSLGTTVSGTGTFYYQNVGTSFSNRVAPRKGGSWSAGAASPILHARPRSSSLSLVGSNHGSRGLVWVIRQQH